MTVNGNRAHRTVNELSMDRGKNFALSIIFHSIVRMYSPSIFTSDSSLTGSLKALADVSFVVARLMSRRVHYRAIFSGTLNPQANLELRLCARSFINNNPLSRIPLISSGSSCVAQFV